MIEMTGVMPLPPAKATIGASVVAEHEQPGRAHHVDGVARLRACRSSSSTSARRGRASPSCVKRLAHVGRARHRVAADDRLAVDGGPERAELPGGVGERRLELRAGSRGRTTGCRRSRRRRPRRPGGGTRGREQHRRVPSAASDQSMITPLSKHANSVLGRPRGESRGAQRGHVADDPGHGPGRGAALRRRRGRRRRHPARRLRRRSSAMVDRRGAALMASGVEPGDRVAVWAPNSLEWIVAALGVTTAGGVLVPVNTRFKGAEAAYILARSGARALFTVRGFLDTDYPALLAGAGVAAPRARAHGRSSSGDADARGRSVLGRLPRAGACRAPTPTSTRASPSIGPDDPSDVVFTSGTTGEPEGRGDDARPDAARLPRLVRLGRPAHRRPLPDRQPVLPHLRLQGRLPRLAHARRHHLPARRCSTRRSCSSSSSASGSRCCPGRRRSTSRSSTTPTATGTTSRRLRVAVTGAADIPVELIRRVRDELPFERILTGYGLTEAGTVTGSTPDDDFEHIATTVGVPWPGLRGAHRRRRRRATGRRGEPGEVLVRGDTVMRELPRRPGGDRGRDRRRRAGCTPATSARSTPTATCASSGGSRTCSSSAGSTPTRPRSRTSCSRHPRDRAGRGDRHPRRAPRRGRHGVRRARRRARRSTAGRAHRVGRGEMANYKVPRRVEFVDELPVNATGKVVKDELRARAVPS